MKSQRFLISLSHVFSISTANILLMEFYFSHFLLQLVLLNLNYTLFFLLLERNQSLARSLLILVWIKIPYRFSILIFLTQKTACSFTIKLPSFSQFERLLFQHLSWKILGESFSRSAIKIVGSGDHSSGEIFWMSVAEEIKHIFKSFCPFTCSFDKRIFDYWLANIKTMGREVFFHNYILSFF